MKLRYNTLCCANMAQWSKMTSASVMHPKDVEPPPHWKLCPWCGADIQPTKEGAIEAAIGSYYSTFDVGSRAREEDILRHGFDAGIEFQKTRK